MKKKNTNPKKAGVVALFYPDKEQMTNLLLILRHTYPGIHSNQIGLPGGKAEKNDNNLFDTASVSYTHLRAHETYITISYGGFGV